MFLASPRKSEVRWLPLEQHRLFMSASQSATSGHPRAIYRRGTRPHQCADGTSRQEGESAVWNSRIDRWISARMMTVEPAITVSRTSKRHRCSIRAVRALPDTEKDKLTASSLSLSLVIATRVRGAYKIVPYNEAEYKSKVTDFFRRSMRIQWCLSHS